jgi:hypothetical protein
MPARKAPMNSGTIVISDGIISAARTRKNSTLRPTQAELDEGIAAPGTTLRVARDGQGQVVGTLTLVIYATPN